MKKLQLLFFLSLVFFTGSCDKLYVSETRYPGLHMLNNLITGNKPRRDVLIFGCTNHPADYDDSGICGCVDQSKAHYAEAIKRGLLCKPLKQNKIINRNSNYPKTTVPNKLKY